jgi:hypothetical protein
VEATVTDQRLATAEVAAIDPPSPEEVIAAMTTGSLPYLGSTEGMKNIAGPAVRYPELYKAKLVELLKSGAGVYVPVPVVRTDAEGNDTPWSYYYEDYNRYGGRGPLRGDVGEALLPTGEDAERWLRLVRKLPREVRISRRDRYLKGYEGYFGRVYPKDLREERID